MSEPLKWQATCLRCGRGFFVVQVKAPGPKWRCNGCRKAERVDLEQPKRKRRAA